MKMDIKLYGPWSKCPVLLQVVEQPSERGGDAAGGQHPAADFAAGRAAQTAGQPRAAARRP